MRTNNMKYAAIVALGVLLSCSGEKKETTDKQDDSVKVKVETVHMQDVDQQSEFTATTQANITNMIAPQTMVRIEKLHVEVGDHVRTGQLLATTDTTSLRQTRLQMENQELEFRRMDELYKIGGVSKSAWDAQKTALDVSRTAYRNLQKNSRLVSPIGGMVTARNYDSGDMYNGSSPIYVIEQIHPVKLLVYVSESYFTKVQKGMEVDVRFDVFGDEVFRGVVHLIHPTIDPSTRTFAVEVRINNADERVRPGMFARITINFGTLRHVVTPDRAIIKQAGSGDRYVYVYSNGSVAYQKVELGRRMDNRYEVISGIQDGDQVVVTGLNRLSNGLAVEVVK